MFEPREVDVRFLRTLQTVLDEILCYHGGHKFQIAHIRKESIFRSGMLLERIKANERAIIVFRFTTNQPGIATNDDNNDDNQLEKGN